MSQDPLPCRITKLDVQVDDDDLEAINRVVAKQQANVHMDKSTLPDGGGNMLGRILGEICRDLEEYQSWFEMENPL